MKKILWLALFVALTWSPASAQAPTAPASRALSVGEHLSFPALEGRATRYVKYDDTRSAIVDAETQFPLFTFEQRTVSSVAVSLSSATYSGMQGCSVTVESNTIRYRPDGTAPTASVGVPVTAGTTLIFSNVAALPQTSFIRASADATAWAVCWRGQ